MSETVNEDARDVEQARNGDRAAFARLYDRHAAVVLSICRIHASAFAEDATQECFIRAYRKLDTLDDPCKLRPWLFGIAKFVCSEMRRASTRRTHYEANAMMLNSTAAHHQASDHQPTTNTDRAEQLVRLQTAMEQLDDRQRLAIHLYYLDRDPVSAAFEALGLSRSAYYKLLNKAKARLATILQEAPAS